MKQTLKYSISVVISLIIGIIGTIVVLHYFPINSETLKTIKEISIKEENTIKESINKVYDCTIYIETKKAGISVGSGSGFIYKKDENFGYILTNNHVVEGATNVYVTNTSNVTVEATVLGNDSYLDLAVLAVPKTEIISVCQMGDSTSSSIGDTVFTVGSPMGKEYMGSVTKGIVSGKNRQISVTLDTGSFLIDVIQVDAAINPGNSGGPLVNINGEIIGITSAKLVNSNIEGMGFAIPIEMAMSSIDKLETGEKIERPMVGASFIDVTNTYALAMSKIKLDKGIKSGAVVAKIVNGYPFEKAGLKIGDVITKIDDNEITNSAKFKYILYKYSIGSNVKIIYNRDGNEKEVVVKLDKVLGN